MCGRASSITGQSGQRSRSEIAGASTARLYTTRQLRRRSIISYSLITGSTLDEPCFPWGLPHAASFVNANRLPDRYCRWEKVAFLVVYAAIPARPVDLKRNGLILNLKRTYRVPVLKGPQEQL